MLFVHDDDDILGLSNCCFDECSEDTEFGFYFLVECHSSVLSHFEFDGRVGVCCCELMCAVCCICGMRV